MLTMDCRRVEELLSDHLEGALHAILRSEVEAHLAACPPCAELRSCFGEVVAALQDSPEREPAADLAARAASAAIAHARTHRVGPSMATSSWVQATAAGLALVALGAGLIVAGPERSSRAARRLVNRTLRAGIQVTETKDRLVEDVRILGVVITTAFEGRVDRVNERVEDYRRLLERRRSGRQGNESRGGEPASEPHQVATDSRTKPHGVT